MYIPDKPLVGGDVHQPLANFAVFLDSGNEAEHNLIYAKVNLIFSSGNTAEAVALLTKHGVSLAASLSHLGLSYTDLKNHTTVPGLQHATGNPIPLIKAVRALTGWRLAPTVWILKLLAMANLFYDEGPLPTRQVNGMVAEAEVDAFRSRMLALGYTVEVAFNPVN